MPVVHALAVLALSGALVQGATAQPELISLLEAGDEARLRKEVRSRPDDARGAIAELFRLTVQADRPEGRVEKLLQAEQIAQAYAAEWSDSFLTRRVDHFRAWSADERMEKLEADSVRRAAVDAFFQQGPEAAIRLWERSLSQYRALGDAAGQAAALGNLGSGYYAMGQLDRALRYHTRSLELAEAAGDHRTKGNALGNIASVHKDEGELTVAAEFYGRALEIRPLTGDRRGESADLNNLGLVRDELGDLNGAEEHFRQALELNRADDRLRSAATNLTNLANVATKRGAYDAALDLYNQALATRRETADRRGEAHDLRSLGLLHLRWGDYPSALGSLEASLAVLAEIGPAFRRAQVRSDIAAAREAMGQLRTALEDMERARAELGDEGWELGPELALQEADLLTELNDYETAAELYREAREGFRELEYPAGQAEAEHGLGSLHLAQEEYEAAEEALTRARLIQESLPDPRPAALTQLMLGHVQQERGDSAAARETYRRALAVHESLGDAVAEAAALGALADLDHSLAAFDAAADGYRSALTRLHSRPAPTVEWQLHAGLGLTFYEQGRLADAGSELQAAIAQLESIGASLPVEERRYGYLEDKWSVYADLVKTELARGQVEAALEVSEQMRARQLIDLLARGRLGSGIADESIVREEQTLRRRIAQLADALNVSRDGQRALRGPEASDPGLDDVREQLVAAQAEYQRLLVTLKASHPEYAALISGSTATVEDVQKLLPADAILIEYLISDDWSVAFVVSSQDVSVVQLPIEQDELRGLIEFFRGTVGPLGGANELWRAPLRRLNQALIAPLEEAGYLEGRSLLVFAPHAELHYLPFQALLKSGSEGESFLIESFDVAYVPSASAWAFLSQRTRSKSGRGLLAMAPRPESLTSSAEEVHSISRGEGGASVLVGPRATETRFRSDAPDHRVVHLATYGILNTVNPLFSFVEMNPGPDTDGRLEVHEVFGLELTAQLVVLSACQTALGSGLRRDVPPGDDWVGLVRAFLTAGAENVVASLWSVEDRATAELMESFYDGLREGRSKASALGDAQRAFLREKKYANPFYWAAFVLVGNAG